MDILESLRLGAEIYEGLNQFNKRKQLFQDYSFTENKTNLPRSQVFLDLESNKQFLIAPSFSKHRFTVFRRDFTGIRKVSELGLFLVDKAAWVSWDASLCFSLEQSKVHLWDSNSGKVISNYESMKFTNFQPALKEKELVLLNGPREALLLDFISGEVVEKGFQATGDIKWSPFSENYFLTGKNEKCLFWDIRRLRSPVFSLGFKENLERYKKMKADNMTNAYDLMFFKGQLNSFQDNILDFSFAIDGRWVFIQTASGIFRVNLTCVDNEPELVVAQENQAGLVLETHLGLVSAKNNGLIRYGEYFDPVQVINFPIVKLVEIPDEDVWYLLDSFCEIRRLSV
jgi:WD40 repeat protein